MVDIARMAPKANMVNVDTNVSPITYTPGQTAYTYDPTVAKEPVNEAARVQYIASPGSQYTTQPVQPEQYEQPVQPPQTRPVYKPTVTNNSEVTNPNAPSTLDTLKTVSGYVDAARKAAGKPAEASTIADPNTLNTVNIANSINKGFSNIKQEQETSYIKELLHPETGKSVLEHLEEIHKMPISLREAVEDGKISKEVKQRDEAKRQNMMRNYNDSITNMQNAMGSYYYSSNNAKNAERQKLQKQYIDNRHIMDRLTQVSSMNDFILSYLLPTVTAPAMGVTGTIGWTGAGYGANALYDEYKNKVAEIQNEILANNPKISEEELNKAIKNELFNYISKHLYYPGQ